MERSHFILDRHRDLIILRGGHESFRKMFPDHLLSIRAVINEMKIEELEKFLYYGTNGK